MSKDRQRVTGIVGRAARSTRKAIALVVSLHVRPDHLADFLAAARRNAASSQSDEPGCLRFDIVQDHSDPAHFFFYEIYVDDEALSAHRQSQHFAHWVKAKQKYVLEDRFVPTTGDLLSEG